MLEEVNNIYRFTGYLCLLKVGITHGGDDIRVTKDFLDLIKVESVLNQPCCMGMAQGMCSATNQTSPVECTTKRS